MKSAVPVHAGRFLRPLRSCPSPVLALAVTLAIGASGCLLDGNSDHAQPVGSRIVITLSERLEQSGRSLILNCRSENPYRTFKYQLIYSPKLLGPVIRIIFWPAGSVGLRQAGSPVPFAGINLGCLAPGTYHLAIDAGGETLDADLFVSPDSYVVTNGEGPTAIFPAPRLNRVPEKTIWGLVGYLGHPGEPFDSLADAFLDSLATRGATVRSFEPGDYGYFYIDESGAIQRPPTDGYYYARPYIRQFSGDPTALRDMVAYFGRTQSFWLSIRLLTWRGDKYYGWVLGGSP